MRCVQVGLRQVWSSRNQQFSGLCMTHNELATLCDVYQTLSPDYRQSQTSYVLQTLWRDPTSDVIIIKENVHVQCSMHNFDAGGHHWTSLHQ